MQKILLFISLPFVLSVSVIAYPLYAQIEPPPPPSAEELAAEAEKQAQAKRNELYEQALIDDEDISAKLDKEAFKGITIAGEAIPTDLYPLHSVDADSSEITERAIELIDLFADSEQLSQLLNKDIQSPNWRKWRADAVPRVHGVSLINMNEDQKKAAMAILQAALSIEGYEEVTSIMKLTAVTGELNGEPELYNEDMYWFSIFGNPQEGQPWGVQVDGNHLSINMVVVGNQIVFSPILLAAEPTLAPTGTQYAGETALQFKHNGALSFIQSLEQAQQNEAVIHSEKTDNQLMCGVMQDNVDLAKEGLNAKQLTNAEKQALMNLIKLWVGDLRDEHADVWLNDIQAHLNETYIAWWGDTSGDKPFYLRIINPVIVIELDHQSTSALKNNPSYEGTEPRLDYVKTVVRQPNGNDYGKALLQSLKAYQAK